MPRKAVHSDSYLKHQSYDKVRTELGELLNQMGGSQQDHDLPITVGGSQPIDSESTLESDASGSCSVLSGYILAGNSCEVREPNCETKLVKDAVAILVESSISTNALSDSEEEVDDCSVDTGDNNDNKDENVRDFLQLWSCQFNVANNAVDSLLAYFKQYHPNLPLSAKTLKETPRHVPVKLLNNGHYAHLGLRKGLLNKSAKGFVGNVHEVQIDVFVDGVQIYQSVNDESWPLMARCVNFVDSRPFIIGIFYGVHKPDPIEEYLRDYIEEAKELLGNGVTIKGCDYPFKVRYYLGDAPARAFLKCIVGHTSKNGCERCDQCGDYDGMVIYSTRTGAERTDDSFDTQRDAEHHKGYSPLRELGTKFITQFILEPMHMVDIGVFKRLLTFVLSRGPVNTRLSGEGLADFAESLDVFAEFVPCEFSRKHPALDRRPKWKSTEYRLLLLYLGLVIFKLLFKEEIYHLFLLLHTAIFIMSNEVLIECYLEDAQSFIELFVKYSSEIFGPKFVSYNVHSLLHLTSDIKRHGGTLIKMSAYPFEDKGGSLKKLVRSSSKPLQQICCRMIEKEKVEHKLEERVSGRGPLLEHSSGPIANLKNVSSQFKKYEDKMFTISINIPDNCVCLSDGQFGIIQNIVIVSLSVKVIVKTFECTRDFYDYPMQSSNLGVCVLLNLSENLNVYDLSDILYKCMCLPYGHAEFVGIPLLHLM